MLRRHSDLPLEKDTSNRFLPWIIAFMVWLAALALAGAMAFSTAVGSWSAGLAGTLTVQIVGVGSGKDSERALAKEATAAAEYLRATPGIAKVRVLERKEILALLEPWLGKGETAGELPLPRLLDVTVAAGRQMDIGALDAGLKTVAPNATVDDHRKWLTELLTLLRSVEVITAAIVLLTALVAVFTVVFAARAGLAVHLHVVELLHLIGAHNGYVARQFQYHALSLGLKGGLIGLVMAGLTVFALDYFLGGNGGITLPELSLTPLQWAILAALPVLTSLLAMFTARFTVIRALAKMP